MDPSHQGGIGATVTDAERNLRGALYSGDFVIEVSGGNFRPRYDLDTPEAFLHGDGSLTFTSGSWTPYLTHEYGHHILLSDSTGVKEEEYSDILANDGIYAPVNVYIWEGNPEDSHRRTGWTIVRHTN